MNSSSSASGENRRILIIDDNAEIHRDIAKVLQIALENPCPPIDERTAARLGVPFPSSKSPAIQPFDLTSAYQGEEGLAFVQAAAAEGRPFAAAFVDGRMPPGWDGIETVQRLWACHPDLQVIICTAYADYTWEQIMGIVGGHDNLVILKKPFDVIEVQQIAESMVRRWNRNRIAERQIEELAGLIREVHDPASPAALPSDANRSTHTGGGERSDLIAEHARVLARQILHRVQNSKSAVVGRLATTLRPHHGQLGAFGRKLPDFLTQLSEQLDGERIALTQLITSLQHNIDRLRDPPGSGVARQVPASAVKNTNIVVTRILGAEPNRAAPCFHESPHARAMARTGSEVNYVI